MKLVAIYPKFSLKTPSSTQTVCNFDCTIAYFWCFIHFISGLCFMLCVPVHYHMRAVCLLQLNV